MDFFGVWKLGTPEILPMAEIPYGKSSSTYHFGILTGSIPHQKVYLDEATRVSKRSQFFTERNHEHEKK